MGSKASEIPTYTVGCLFAAIGGFCRAFQMAGATVLWANEKDRFAKETFELNFPNVRYLSKPVENLSVGSDRLEPVDVLTAGFPCQPFSIAGEKLGFKDVRGELFLEIIRIIREFGTKKPKILLLENVKNFSSHDNGRTFKRVQTEIQKTGYWFSERNAKILNTATYTTIPQNRERIFMVAMSCDHFNCNSFKFPEPLPAGSMRKVKEFLEIKRKAPPEFYFAPGSQYHPLFKKALDAGDPESVYQLRRSYVRENKTGMCFTLMANMGEGGHNQPVIKDKWGIRKITPLECARLQGYDDSWFKIPEEISRTQICKQLGNSVTIPLVSILAKSCLAELEKSKAPKRLDMKHKKLSAAG